MKNFEFKEYRIWSNGELREIDKDIDYALRIAVEGFARALLDRYRMLDSVLVEFDEVFGDFLYFFSGGVRVGVVKLAVKCDADYFEWRDVNVILRDIIETINGIVIRDLMRKHKDHVRGKGDE